MHSLCLYYASAMKDKHVRMVVRSQKLSKTQSNIFLSF